MNYIIQFIRGFCMALADSVPGVSGGTIAFLLGFYDKFITALSNFLSKDKEKRKEAIVFLIKLLIGWAVGFGLSVLLLGNIFESHIYQISSLFLGLIIFSIPIVIKEEKESYRKYKNVFFTIIGIAIVILISLFSPSSENGINISVQSLNIGIILYVFFVAMVAISAMVLPGISGSTLLLIFGLYIPIITAIKELMHLNFSYLPILIVFGLGVLIGIVSTIKIIKKCLEKFRSQTMYLILGLMLGSIYPVILGATTLEVPKPAMSFSTFSIVFFLIGGIIIIGLQKFKDFIEKKESKKALNAGKENVAEKV